MGFNNAPESISTVHGPSGLTTFHYSTGNNQEKTGTFAFLLRQGL
jgi:hypothetical protein